MDIRFAVAEFLSLCLLLMAANSDFKSETGETQSVKFCTLISDKTANCSHLQLTFIPQDIPSSIHVLNLSYNKLTKLKNYSFEKFRELWLLDLGKNRIQMMEDGTFQNVASLKILYLDNNEIIDLPEFLFRGTPLLWKLSLRYNKLDSIPNVALKGLRTLYNLNLKGNRINGLDFEAFSSWSYMDFIDLSENNLSSIHQEDFKPLRGCRISTLSLAKNKITFLPPRIFADLYITESLRIYSLKLSELHLMSLTGHKNVSEVSVSRSGIKRIIPLNASHGGSSQVKKLIMQSNNLTQIPDYAFVGFDKLGELDLESNQISFISNFSFCGLNSLTWLNLEDNKIQSLPNAGFDCMPSLQVLYLSKNSLRSLQSGIFVGVRTLTVLSLSKNRFTIFYPAWLAGSKSLTYVDLYNNEINGISNNSWNLVSLQKLDLSVNAINRLEEWTFTGLPNLTVLNISNNHNLQTAAVNVFNKVSNLQYLSMAYLYPLHLNGIFASLNNLLCLDLFSVKLEIDSIDQFTNTTSLQELNVSFTRLHSSNLVDSETGISVFTGLESLQTLNLKGNFLQNLHEYHGIFSPVANLEHLNLAYCKITVLHIRTFSPLPSLKSLMLNNNHITKVFENAFFQLHNLEILLLQYSQIEAIPKNLLANSHNLTKLFIQGNKISTILPQTILPASLIRLDISGNPYACNCDLSWFRQFLEESNADLRPKNEIICSQASFKELINQPVWSFHPEALCGVNIGLIAGTSFAVFTIISLCGLVFYKRWWLNHKFFLLKLAILGYKDTSEERSFDDYQYHLNVVFHGGDESWVIEVMKPALEERIPHLDSIIWGDEDLNLGMFYINAIYDALENSYKTVLLLSNRCVDDAWFMTKLRMALEHVNDTKLDKVFLVFLEDIGDANLPYLVRLFLSKNKPYLLWTDDEDGQELFWAQFEKSMRENRVINNVIPI